MKKIFTFLFAALMSVGMFAETTVTFTKSEMYNASGNSFTKDGVTMTVGGVDRMGGYASFLNGSISFTTTTELAFVKIEVQQKAEQDKGNITGDGWSGTTWEGNAKSVSGSYHQDSFDELWQIEQVICTLDEPAQVTTYTLELSVNDSTMGKIVLANAFKHTGPLDNAEGKLVYEIAEGDTAIIRATPNEGFAFKGWKYGNLKGTFYRDTLISDLGRDTLFSVLGRDTLISGLEETYELTLIVKKNMSVMAEFEAAAPATYTLLLVADSTKGSVAVTNLLGSDIIDNGNGNYTVPANAEVTILATPNEGYEFTGWKVGNIDEMVGCYYCGTALNTVDNPQTFTMTEDIAYLADFAAKSEGIENIVLTEGAKKVVENGMIYIVRDGKLFDLTGAQVR